MLKPAWIFLCLLLPPFAQAETMPSAVSLVERYRARDFVVLLELDNLPLHILQWDKDKSEVLLIEDGVPKLLFSGRIKQNYHFYFNNKKVPLRDGTFNFKFRVPLETTPIPLKIIGPNGTVSEYRLLNHWISIPPKLKLRSQDEDRNDEATFGLKGIFKPSAFVQLYSEGRPIQLVDLDSQQHSKLTFRVLTSVSDVYDGWMLVIRDDKNRVRSKIGRFGSPPDFIDWREVSSDITREGKFTYQVNLFYEGRLYEGKVSQFESFEGTSVIPDKYSPWLTIQPEGGFGFLQYKDAGNNRFNRVYMTFDFPIIFFNRAIVRLGGWATLHSDGSNNNMNFTRIGAGMRVFGGGRDTFLGKTFGVKLDTTLNTIGYAVSGDTFSGYRLKQTSILVEAHLLLWSYHYLLPWVEFGFNPGRTSNSVRYGGQYIFYVRPWSVNVSIGVARDRLLTVTPQSREFDVFRTVMKLVWFM